MEPSIRVSFLIPYSIFVGFYVTLIRIARKKLEANKLQRFHARDDAANAPAKIAFGATATAQSPR